LAVLKLGEGAGAGIMGAAGATELIIAALAMLWLCNAALIEV
jgi:hypothetical protein